MIRSFLEIAPGPDFDTTRVDSPTYQIEVMSASGTASPCNAEVYDLGANTDLAGAALGFPTSTTYYFHGQTR